MADFGLNTAGETATASVAWLDQDGNAITSGAPTTVTSDDAAGDIATVVPSADGLSAEVAAVADGSVTVTFTTQNSEGADVSASGTVTVALVPPPPAPDVTSGDVTWTQP